MKKIKYILLLNLIFLYLFTEGQVKTNFNNEALISNQGRFAKVYKTQIDLELPAKNIDAILEIEKQELALSKETKPFRLAVPVSINLDISKLLQWTSDKEFAYSKYTIKLNGALSSSINFDKFYLPKGTEMYVYNENGNMITGPITENENNPNKIWGSWVYQGAFITLEVKIPSAAKGDLVLHANNIAYGYKEIYKSIKVGGFGQSGSCNINVICPLGNGWEAERNSVSLILDANGASFCSGSMIMNSCNTNRPFFLTANHCFVGQDVTKWRFTFQAWSSTCPNPGINSDGVTYNGSTLRANWANSDFCLVELNNAPPSNSGINYAGWTRSATPAQNATGIHHPSGDVMKISRAANPIAISTYTTYPANHHWQVTWTQGVTEGGSSGSPLFDQNHRVVGQLTGGPSVCGGSALRDYYGRFDLSWTGGGTNDTRLSNWLDPSTTGVITTNTTNISALPNVNFVITGNNLLCTSQTYSVNTTLPITWSASSSGYVNFSCTNCNSTTVTRSGTVRGNITLTAAVNSGCASGTSASIPVSVGSPISISSNISPCSGTYQTWALSANPSTNGTNWNWTVGNVTTGSNVYIYNQNSATPLVNVSGFGAVRVNYTDACGTAQQDGITVYSSCRRLAVIAPNPASDIVTVSTTATKQLESNAASTILSSWKIYRINVLNKQGTILKIFSYPSGVSSTTINLGNLLNGTYTLQTYDNSTWSDQQIVILR